MGTWISSSQGISVLTVLQNHQGALINCWGQGHTAVPWTRVSGGTVKHSCFFFSPTSCPGNANVWPGSESQVAIEKSTCPKAGTPVRVSLSQGGHSGLLSTSFCSALEVPTGMSWHLGLSSHLSTGWGVSLTWRLRNCDCSVIARLLIIPNSISVMGRFVSLPSSYVEVLISPLKIWR